LHDKSKKDETEYAGTSHSHNPPVQDDDSFSFFFFILAYVRIYFYAVYNL
jgi:hypothetical protein